MTFSVGPNPLPSRTRTFQALLGEDGVAQMQVLAGSHPDVVVTAIGSDSAAVGLFRPFFP